MKSMVFWLMNAMYIGIPILQGSLSPPYALSKLQGVRIQKILSFAPHMVELAASPVTLCTQRFKTLAELMHYSLDTLQIKLSQITEDSPLFIHSFLFYPTNQNTSI
jgi:hypothetical protein